MHDMQKALLESNRLIAISRQRLKEFQELLRQSQKIMQQSRGAILNSKSIASD
jgi:hypothetical protein